MQTHVKVLAVLMIVLSAFGILAAFGMLAAFGLAGGIVGASGDPDAAIALPIIGLTGMAFVIFFLVISLPGLITGFGLLRLRPWARIVGIVLCVLQLFNFPFGTLIGAYGLWVLLNSETERMFNTGVMTAVP
jgi:hypothetical protein